MAIAEPPNLGQYYTPNRKKQEIVKRNIAKKSIQFAREIDYP
jgi:hypothetical protein